MKKILKVVALLVGMLTIGYAFAASNVKSGDNYFVVRNYTADAFTIYYHYQGEQVNAHIQPLAPWNNNPGAYVPIYPYTYVTVDSIYDNTTGAVIANGNFTGGYYDIQHTLGKQIRLIRVR